MSLIKPLTNDKKIASRIKLNESTLNEINLYCQYAGFKKTDEFLESAATHILTKDKKFRMCSDTPSEHIQKGN